MVVNAELSPLTTLEDEVILTEEEWESISRIPRPMLLGCCPPMTMLQGVVKSIADFGLDVISAYDFAMRWSDVIRDHDMSYSPPMMKLADYITSAINEIEAMGVY